MEFLLICINYEEEAFAAQIFYDPARAFWGHKDLAELTAVADAFEQGQPLVRAGLAVARDPLDTAQPLYREQQIQVRDLTFAVQVIETVVEMITAGDQIRHYVVFEHLRADHIREVALKHIGLPG